MKPRQRAAVNPATLSWARRVAGFSVEDAGKRSGMSADRLTQWEAGKARPTLRQLRLLGKAYRRPSAFFFKSKPPEDPQGIPDFRLLPDGAPAEGDSPALRYEIRRAQSRRQTALEIMSLIGEVARPVVLSAHRADGPERVGDRIRDALGVTIPEQFRWRDQYRALREWTRATERVGVLVLQFSNVELDEARGFSFAESPLSVIALNGKDSPRGRIFTLLHELAHIALGQGGLCDLHEQDEGEWVEPFCNSVAAEALVPRKALLETSEVRNHRRCRSATFRRAKNMPANVSANIALNADSIVHPKFRLA